MDPVGAANKRERFCRWPPGSACLELQPGLRRAKLPGAELTAPVTARPIIAQEAELLPEGVSYMLMNICKTTAERQGTARLSTFYQLCVGWASVSASLIRFVVLEKLLRLFYFIFFYFFTICDKLSNIFAESLKLKYVTFTINVFVFVKVIIMSRYNAKKKHKLLRLLPVLIASIGGARGGKGWHWALIIPAH